MSRESTVSCKSCGINMVPRPIYRRGILFGSQTYKPVGSCCPVCQSTNWAGDSSSISDLFAVFKMHPGLAVVAVVTGIPALIAFVMALMIVFVSMFRILPAVIAGEGTFWALMHSTGAGPALFGLLGLLALLAGMIYIPFTYYGNMRKK